jgi:hypothetical protein
VAVEFEQAVRDFDPRQEATPRGSTDPASELEWILAAPPFILVRSVDEPEGLGINSGADIWVVWREESRRQQRFAIQLTLEETDEFLRHLPPRFNAL